jgi:hypothetical protein
VSCESSADGIRVAEQPGKLIMRKDFKWLT